MKELSLIDLAVFGGYMTLLISVGVWFTRQQKDLKTYLLAGRDVHWVVVAISVLAALFSGISFLGAPAETYHNNLVYIWAVVSFFIATPLTAWVFLPFFRGLNLYTAYEYLERRFDRRLQRLASGLFILRLCVWLGVVIYAPALALKEVTGLSLDAAILFCGAAATFYTALGGMKAVVWTDTIQFVVLCGGIFLILVLALSRVPGGPPEAWRLASEGNRTEFFKFDFSLTERLTVWSALLGGLCANLVQMVTDQISVQRYLTAPSLKDSRKALWLKLWVTLPIVGMIYMTGTVLYAYYAAHPHLLPTLDRKDQILPYFVVTTLPTPFPGLLTAAVFGATVSVASAGINALATATLVDFRDAPPDQHTDHRRQVLIARLVSTIYGILITVAALAFSRLSQSLVEGSNLVMGCFGGPLLGLFLLGALSRRANATGAIVGTFAGMVVGLGVAFAPRLGWYPISFMWTPLASTATAFLVGVLMSWLTAPPPEHAMRYVFRWEMAKSSEFARSIPAVK